MSCHSFLFSLKVLWLCIPLSPFLYKHLRRKTFALWIHNLHNKKSVYFGYSVQWFSVLFAELYNHHHSLVLEYSQPPQRNFVPISNHSSIPRVKQPQIYFQSL